ncbi:MAG: class I SAM-dependent methyltransferase [Spirochaetes bacterium]|nr:class I SAM-dependent methyltransferase [Spirochaetota bacterium]
MICTLCGGETSYFESARNRDYYSCGGCAAVLLHPRHYLSIDDERRRYLAHTNDIEDRGYRDFVSPMLTAVRAQFTASHTGLDFGSGASGIITALLREHGYSVTPYDPLFRNDSAALTRKYDYIACCEAVEHFRTPAEEFRLLASLLKPGGALFIMTACFTDTPLAQWHYASDTTHLFFYRAETFAWIQSHFGFSSLSVEGRLIILKK